MAPSDLDCGLNADSIRAAVQSLYFILLLPGLVLNAVALWVSLHLRSTSTFMVYLKNLVAADLLMTLIIPLKVASEHPGSSLVLKALACRCFSTIFYCCMYISIILLGLISLDRFFKIVRPGGRLLGQNLVVSKVLSVCIWVFFLCSHVLPTIILTDQDPSNKTGEFCMNMKSEAGLQLHKTLVAFDIAIFWAVFILISLCYVVIGRKVYQSYHQSGSSNDQGIHKVKFRVFVILLVFLLCFVPYNVTRIFYFKVQVDQIHSCKKIVLSIIKSLTLLLAATNICLDPLIYFFLCKPFREKLCEINPLGSTFISQSSPNNPQTNLQPD